MPELDPDIHQTNAKVMKMMDCRVKAGNDGK